ncbi:MAG: hypothetical protein V1921_06465 [Candidatus Altiarchaeota archaeon]
MTGTKVVKLKLEDAGGGNLPKLKDTVLAILETAYKSFEHKPEDVRSDRYAFALASLVGVDANEARVRSKKTLISMSNVNCDERTIQAFIDKSLISHQREGEFQGKAGIFLNALISTSPEEKLTLDLRKLKRMNNLCSFMEDKDVTLIGDVGDWTAYAAWSGKVTIKGNAGNGTGCALIGATVIVEGDAGDDTARSAEGGEIHIKGDCGMHTGEFMKGGKLLVNGKIAELSDKIKGGEVWQGKTRIYP